MTVEIISVGTEILLGNVVNTNAAFLAEKSAGLGLICIGQSVVGDDKKRLTQALCDAKERADIVLITGGMGPAEDDITKETAARLCKRDLKEDADCKKRILEYYAQKKKKPAESNFKQALIPEGAIVMPNDNGTSPGVILETGRAKLLLFPGNPEQLAGMFETYAVPYLQKLTPEVIDSQTVKICGILEGEVTERIKDLVETYTNPSISSCAKTDEVHIRVTAMAEGHKETKKLIKPVVKELKARFGYDIYSTEEDVNLEKSVVELMKANNLTITCAESCSGGMLASRIIDVPGASDIFKIGIVTYSNKAKRKFLGVKKSTLQKYGAVSEQTAKEMAKGAALNNKADVAVAITGIAGPDGGTPEKPVGLVYIGCCVKGETTVREYRFKGNRTRIRQASVAAALMLMRACVLEYISKVTFGKE